MECLWLIIGLAAVGLLLGIFYQLTEIRKETEIIMGNQAEFNEQVAGINAAIASLGEAVATEAQQTRDFIAGLPESVDTSALDGIAKRLSNIATSVSEIFVPPAPAEESTPAE